MERRQVVEARSASAFQVQVAMATIAPWAVVAVFGGNRWVLGAMVAVFAAHVPTTACIYFDDEARPLIRDHPQRYVVAPLAAVAVLVGIAMWGPGWLFHWHLVGITLWTLHHFTRQTYGITALICAARGVPRPSTTERHLVTATGYAAMLVVIGRSVDALAVAAPAAGAAVIAGCAVAVLVHHVRARGDLGRLMTLTGVVAFYVPLFVFTDPVVAAATYGTAHGAQYLVMIHNLGRGRDAVAARRFVATAVAAFALGGVALWALSSGGASDHRLAVGAVNGMLAWHFITDAGLWRMSQPFQRKYVSRRFDFLPAPASQTASRPLSAPIDHSAMPAS